MPLDSSGSKTYAITAYSQQSTHACAALVLVDHLVWLIVKYHLVEYRTISTRMWLADHPVWSASMLVDN